MSITSGGDVGIGTTGPGYQLDVQGSNGYINAKTGLCIAGTCQTSWNISGAATNLAGGLANEVPYQTGASATTFTGQPGANVVLFANSGAPAWTNTPTLTGTNFTGIPESGVTSLSTDLSNRPTGSGTGSYTARWTGTNTLGIGALYDNGTNVGVGTASPQAQLDVNGSSELRVNTASANFVQLQVGAVAVAKIYAQ
ncbi:MAG: hypothetical protein ACYCPQ_10560 [Elusimicrobiota bacterium]